MRGSATRVPDWPPRTILAGVAAGGVQRRSRRSSRPVVTTVDAVYGHRCRAGDGGGPAPPGGRSRRGGLLVRVVAACHAPSLMAASSASIDATIAWIGIRPVATSYPGSKTARRGEQAARSISQTCTTSRAPVLLHGLGEVRDIVRRKILRDVGLEATHQLVEVLEVVDFSFLRHAVVVAVQNRPGRRSGIIPLSTETPRASGPISPVRSSSSQPGTSTTRS